MLRVVLPQTDGNAPQMALSNAGAMPGIALAGTGASQTMPTASAGPSTIPSTFPLLHTPLGVRSSYDSSRRTGSTTQHCYWHKHAHGCWDGTQTRGKSADSVNTPFNLVACAGYCYGNSHIY